MLERRERERERERDEIASDTRMQRGVTISSGGPRGMHRGDVPWRERPHRVYRLDGNEARRKRQGNGTTLGCRVKYARTWCKRARLSASR